MCCGQEILERDVILVVSQLDHEVVRRVDVSAIDVAPIAEFVALPRVATERGQEIWIPSIADQELVGGPRPAG